MDEAAEQAAGMPERINPDEAAEQPRAEATEQPRAEATEQPRAEAVDPLSFLQEDGGASPAAVNFSEVFTCPRYQDDHDEDNAMDIDGGNTEVVCEEANEVKIMFDTEVLTFEEYRRQGITKYIFKRKVRECMRMGAPAAT
jgi:hypothetical protein